MTLIIDAQFFHFLVLLKNYDGRRLKHKLEFLCGQSCSHLAHTELVYNFWLESSLSFHFSVQFFRLVTLATDKGIMISEVFRYVITPTHEFFVQNCVSFPRLL